MKFLLRGNPSSQLNINRTTFVTVNMERFLPSQIDWTAFENRDPTSIAQLSPPSNSTSSRETTLDQSTAQTTPNTSVSDRTKTADANRRFLASPYHYPDYIKSIESLRSFVEREIGLAAIDNRLSVPVLDEGSSSSWSTTDSDSINLEAWTKEQANRLNCDEGHCQAHEQRDGARADDRSGPVNRNSKRNIMIKLKGKLRASPHHVTHRKADSTLENCRIEKGGVKLRVKAIISSIRKGFCQLIGRA